MANGLKTYLKKWGDKKNSFTSNLIKLMSGTVFAQALGVLILPIVTRFFAPEEFGVFGLFTAIVGIIGVIVCLRYELAILLPKKDEDAASIYWICILITLIWTLVSIIIIIFFKDYLISVLNSQELSKYLWLLPIAIFIAGIQTANGHWNTRRAEFGRLATSQIANSVITQSGRLSTGFGGYITGGALIISDIAGSIASIIVLAKKIWKSDKFLLIKGLSTKSMKFMMIEYKNIAIYNSSSSLFTSFSQNVPILLFGYYFSPIIVGYYIFSKKLLHIPLQLISKSIKKVYFQKSAELVREKGTANNLTVLLMQYLIIISCIILVLIFSLAEYLIPIVFGAMWNDAIAYIVIMSFWILIVFVTKPFNSIFTVYRLEDKFLLYQLVSFLVKSATIIIAVYYSNDPIIALIAFTLISIIYQVMLIAWIIKIDQIQIYDLMSMLIKYIVFSGLVLIISYFSNIIMVIIVLILYLSIILFLAKKDNIIRLKIS